MKHNILSLAAAAVLALGLGACHDDCQVKPGEESLTGTLSFSSMSVDVSVAETVKQNAPARGSRAGVDVSNFIVSVTSAQGEVKGEWKYSEMPEILTLPAADNYKVQVRSHEVQKAEWERPYYLGEKSFGITDGVVTEIGTVTCKLANIKVSIRYSDDLKAQMSDDVKVNVLANDEGSLDFAASETRSGYFAAVEGSSTLIATFDGTVAGVATHLQRTFTDVQPGHHRIITFRIKKLPEADPELGTIDPSGITVDTDVTDVNINGNIQTEEDAENGNQSPWDTPEPPVNPDDPNTPDDPITPDDPTEDLFTFDCGDVMVDAVNDAEEFGTGDKGNKSAVINITAVNPIEKLEVKIVSGYLTPEFMAGLNLAAEFDVAHPGDFATALSGLGLATGSEVLGQTEVPFDITNLVPLLAIEKKTAGGDFTDSYSDFVLTVTDNKGNSATRTLSFVVKAD